MSKPSYKPAGRLKKSPDGTVRRSKIPIKPPIKPITPGEGYKKHKEEVVESIQAFFEPDATTLASFPGRPGPVDDIPKATIEALKAQADPEKVDLLASVTDEELEIARANRSEALAVEEKLAIIEMRGKGLPIAAIAARLERSTPTVSDFLRSIKSTVALAKIQMGAGALRLADRILEHADIDQSLEVMDRLDVLPKKVKESGTTGPQFNVVIGMPTGAQAGPPAIRIPSQADLESAQKA